MDFNAGEHDMRTLFGFLLGVVVTVGAAYIHDVTAASAVTKPLVNWNELGDVTGGAVDAARNWLHRLTR
jgi:hypothetical protein